MVDMTVEIAMLRKAIATGATRVTYDTGDTVEYDSYEKLIARLRFLEGLSADPNVPTSRKPTVGFASFDRGDR